MRPDALQLFPPILLQRIFQRSLVQLVSLVKQKMELGAAVEPGPMSVVFEAESVQKIDKRTLAWFLESKRSTHC